jgi:hypothetical protein
LNIARPRRELRIPSDVIVARDYGGVRDDMP